MNQENNTIDNEIIDVKPLLNLLNNAFKNLLRLILSVITFYKKKIALFGIFMALGAIGGYFLDKQLKTNKLYKQEIILQPKYQIGSYIYGYIEDLKFNLKDSVFLRKIKLSKSLAKTIKKIEIEPIIQAVDVLDELHVKYGDRDYFHHIIDDYDAQKLEDERYKNFYKHHKLTLYFNTNERINNTISKIILEYLNANTYYNDILSFELKQATSNLEQNKQTLAFVDEYLAKLNKNNSINQEKEIVVFAKESDIPTISSLLERKETLLETINEQEKTIALDNKLIKIVEYNNIISENISISKRFIFLLPILLFGIISMLFFIKNIFKNISV